MEINKPKVDNEPPGEKIFWSVAELYSAEFPEPTWVINEILPTGEAFLSGRPKLGKSWLGLQMAKSVATGSTCLEYNTERGEVLYLALEDQPRRIQSRCKKQGIPDNAPINFLTRFKTFHQGGITDLFTYLEQDRYRLVVVDTLSRFLGKSDQQDLSEMTSVIGELQTMAQKKGVGLLLIDHHRKPSGMESDVIDDVMGSTGKAAAADSILGLYRDRNKREAILKATGRDMEDVELALEWDGYSCTWRNLGEADGVRADSMKFDVINAINHLVSMGDVATTTKIATFMDQKKPNVSRALGELLATGKIMRGEKVAREQPYIVVNI